MPRPVAQAAEPAPGADRRAAAAVVGDLDDEPVPLPPQVDGRARRLGVLLRVDERLRDDEVGGDLDRVGQAWAGPDVERDRDPAGGDERRQGRVEPAVGQDRGGDPADEPAQVRDRRPRLRLRRRHERPGRLRIVGELLLREAEVHRHRDHPRLGAVVAVALDPPQLVRLRVGRRRPRAGQHADPLLELRALARAEDRSGEPRLAAGEARQREGDDRQEHEPCCDDPEHLARGVDPGVRPQLGPRLLRQEPPVDRERQCPEHRRDERDRHDRGAEAEHGVQPDPAEVLPRLRVGRDRLRPGDEALRGGRPVDAADRLAEDEAGPPALDPAEPAVDHREREQDRDPDERDEQGKPRREPRDLDGEADDRRQATEQQEGELARGLQPEGAGEERGHGPNARTARPLARSRGPPSGPAENLTLAPRRAGVRPPPESLESLPIVAQERGAREHGSP